MPPDDYVETPMPLPSVKRVASRMQQRWDTMRRLTRLVSPTPSFRRPYSMPRTHVIRASTIETYAVYFAKK